MRVRTVELLPDDDVDAAVRESWEHLADAGLPSLALHEHETNRPHLTLAEADGLPVDEVRSLLDGSLPVRLSLGAVGIFRTRRGAAVHVVVVPAPALVDLHRRVHDLLVEREVDPRPHLAPGSWAPHVSLALRVPDDEVGRCLDVVGRGLQGVAGWWTSARSYTSDVRAVRPLVSPSGG